MKKKLIIGLLFCTVMSNAQINIKDIFNNTNSNLGNGLSNDEIVSGLKEALSLGSKSASEKASKTDGFYKNNLIKIPFPKEATEMKNTLNSLGMKSQVDAFEKQMNRAAEDAAKKAAPIFINAITKMNISDALSILQGKDDEATKYLIRTTTAQLKQQFALVVKSSLQKVNITKYWTPLTKTYNKVPFVTKIN